ncbi:unnamed protein product [Durusdinium trenchii]|uniref:Rhodanese domain-containing protein n=1 Tax=Durusdinium trenchii TaxID=1381693 RepID=A0ABP0QC90_9DINO
MTGPRWPFWAIRCRFGQFFKMTRVFGRSFVRYLSCVSVLVGMWCYLAVFNIKPARCKGNPRKMTHIEITIRGFGCLFLVCTWCHIHQRWFLCQRHLHFIHPMKSSFPTLEKKVPESKKCPRPEHRSLGRDRALQRVSPSPSWWSMSCRAYAHIGSSIDTGASAKKEKLHSANVTAKRKDEIFKRIRPSTLVRLLQEREVSESVYAMGPGTVERGDGCSSVIASKGPLPVPPSVASVTSVAGSVVSIVETDATVSEERDLVLLDLREPDEFEQCHLPLAVSYPAPKINRDQFIPELLRCKREPSKLLVVYGSNEAVTIGVARLLVEKGWENVHALTGGFEEMLQSYPEVIEGTMPAGPRPGSGRSGHGVLRR